MRILVVGTGYVGLVTGVCFAEMGHHVLCLDIDKKKIEHLKKGVMPIYEPGLQEMVERNTEAKRLSFTTDYQEAVSSSDICFLSLPTPSNPDGSCNLSYILNAIDSISLHLNSNKIIVIKSTVPPGTAHLIQNHFTESLKERGLSFSIDVVSNPEFLKEGSAITDCMKPDRIIVGTESEEAREIMKELYAGFTLNHDRILFMDNLSAEMSKYAANAMLATRISFMNELSHICTLVGANINEVRKGIGSDKRIGYSFLYAGVGYGGSCFPKDIRSLIQESKKRGYSPRILESVDRVNQDQKRVLSDMILSYFSSKGGLQGKTIGIWGLSFKPDTDDLREAPSLVLIQELLAKGAHLRLYDPASQEKAKHLLAEGPGLTWCENEIEAAKGADAVALITEWKQFRMVDVKSILYLMRGRAFFDGRNQYHPKEMSKQGFEYFCIGVPKGKG